MANVGCVCVCVCVNCIISRFRFLVCIVFAKQVIVFGRCLCIYVPHIDAAMTLYTLLIHCAPAAHGAQSENTLVATAAECSPKYGHLLFALTASLFAQTVIGEPFWAVFPHRLMQVPLILLCW